MVKALEVVAIFVCIIILFLLLFFLIEFNAWDSITNAMKNFIVYLGKLLNLDKIKI